MPSFLNSTLISSTCDPFIAGHTKDMINGCIYAFVILSYCLLQVLVEWETFQLKNKSASNDSPTTVGGVVKKTGNKFGSENL